MKEMNVITNVDWFESKIYNDKYYHFDKIVKCSGKVTFFLNCLHYLKYDFAVINISSSELLILCFLKYLFPFFRMRIISVDLLLSKPTNIKSLLASKVKSFLLRKVDYFLVYMKNCSGYEKYYKICKTKIHYLPFKINSYQYVMQKITTDCGYVFSGGVSKRDYDTLFQAVEGLDCKVKILVPENVVSLKHGTTITNEVPPNVSVVHDVWSPEPWVDYIAQAKFVVLPIQASTISSTGISTYLVAMALKKCVIISEGPATLDIIPKDAAIIVPPENVEQLRAAIIKVDNNDALRREIALNGYNFAITHGDHQRLVEDITTFLVVL